jgi:D-lactate dehydrogenase (cytochrome)
VKRAEIRALKRCKDPELMQAAALTLMRRSMQFGHKKLLYKRAYAAAELGAITLDMAKKLTSCNGDSDAKFKIKQEEMFTMTTTTDTSRRSRQAPALLIESLKTRFGSACSTGESVCNQHGRDESPYPTMAPDAVVFAQSTQDVVDAINLCAAHKVPVIPYGAGSSIEGHVLAIHGGITIDVSKMNKVLALDVDDLTCTVQAGVTRMQLNQEIRSSGLFFPIDPGADASMGGMAATRASGTNAVRYGTMRDNVVALTVVTAEGKVITTAGRAKKSSAGYDLTRLFVGSEGTLGLIVEVTVRLYPLPEAVSAAVCTFADVESAVNTVIQSIQLGVPIARAEMLDGLTVHAINRYSKTSLAEQPMLFLEFHGTPASVKEQAQIVQEVATGNGGENFEWAINPEDRTRLWNARHHAFFACLQLKPGSRAFTTDACVPISKLAECIAETAQDVKSSSLPAPIFGHVGDGNFHCVIVADPEIPDEMAEAERLNQSVMQRALRFGGTCSGEHGVGLHKMGLLFDEHGDDAMELMSRVKVAFDPDNIMNPGKLVSV